MSAAEKGKVVELPGVERQGKVFNFEFTFNCGDKSQGRFLTDFPQSMSQADLGRQLDLMRLQARRQQAAYELEALQQELENIEIEDEQHKENLKRSEESHQKQVAQAEADLRAAERKVSDIEGLARNEWSTGNRRSEFDVSKTQRRGDYTAASRVVDSKAEELKKLDVERHRARAKIAMDRAENHKRQDRVKRRIERVNQLLELPQE